MMSLLIRPCRRLTGHQASAQEVEARYAAMPPHMQRSLMPFQRVGVRFGLGLNGRVLIADEMGVGKTVQAIALASCYRVRELLFGEAPEGGGRSPMRTAWQLLLVKFVWRIGTGPSVHNRVGKMVQASVRGPAATG